MQEKKWKEQADRCHYWYYFTGRHVYHDSGICPLPLSRRRQIVHGKPVFYDPHSDSDLGLYLDLWHGDPQENSCYRLSGCTDGRRDSGSETASVREYFGIR